MYIKEHLMQTCPLCLVSCILFFPYSTWLYFYLPPLEIVILHVFFVDSLRSFFHVIHFS